MVDPIDLRPGPEIEQLTTWLDGWGVDVDVRDSDDHGMYDDDTMMGGTGMMSDDEMDTMAAMAGADLEAMFLEMMIRHHQGAIEMAKTELEDGTNADVLAVAQNIIETQQAEIDTMSSMLSAS